MNRKSFGFLLVLAVSLLSGCATLTPQIAVDKTFWDGENQVVGVVVAKSPNATHQMTGLVGLLDMAINKEAASDLIAHLETQQPITLEETAAKFVDRLKQRKISASIIEKQVDINTLPELDGAEKGGKYYAGRDFSSLAEKHNVDKIILLSITQVGTTRGYYGFIPTSDPQGACSVVGQLIDAKTNQLLWNSAKTANTEAEGDWDTPPEFSSLTKAMHTSVEDAVSRLDTDFFKPVVNVAHK